MENQKIVRSNPAAVPAPVGNYTHITKIPRNSELFVASGQIGVKQDGQIPNKLNDQVKQTFDNLNRVLASEQLSSSDIIKVNIWATELLDWEYFYDEWERFFNGEYPAMTVGYLTKLGLEEIKIEIEVWAARV
ncbi:RidA family protein [Paenibacillus senegalensis]|uniref:RidA family protein n=1 Tax=Paenibacillus senegalensis TaxID=1465766 RepID=UPI000288B515|nr:RidA family protein [Paenibacillus senegalensis]